MKVLLFSPLMCVHVYKFTCEYRVCKQTDVSDQTPTLVTNLLEHRSFGYFSFSFYKYQQRSSAPGISIV